MDIIAFEEQVVKWSERKHRSMEVSERMNQAGFKKRASAIAACGEILQFNKCPDCGKTELSSANFCRDRLCPTCAWRLSLRRYAEMCCAMGLVSDKIAPGGAAFLTLTVKNCWPADLRETLKKMTAAWNRMLARRKIKKLFSGWARAVEVTYNEEKANFHPHFHIILILSDYACGLSEGIIRRELSDAWYDAMQTDYRPVTDYRIIASEDVGIDCDDEQLHRAILETYKYTVKSGDLLEMPLGVFRTFVTAMVGVRAASFGGCIKDARRELGYRDDDDREEDAPLEEGRKCPDCGVAMRAAMLKWSFAKKQYEVILKTAKGDNE